MTIHTMMSQGSGVQLGPVKITKSFPFKQGDKSAFMLIEDASGKGALKIWGAAAGAGYREGQVITLVGTGPKGGLRVSEYQGKKSIDANDCRIEFEGGGSMEAAQSTGYQQRQAAPAAQARQSYQAPSDSKPQTLSDEEVDHRMRSYVSYVARFSSLLVEELVVNHGFEKEEAIQLANGAGAGLYPQSWFLEKGFKA